MALAFGTRFLKILINNILDESAIILVLVNIIMLVLAFTVKTNNTKYVNRQKDD